MATYYVSTSGNDSNSGTSTSPWRTIQNAANYAASGSTVYVGDGIYNERVSPKNDNVSYISQNLHGAIIDGSGLGTTSDWGGLIEHIS